MSDSEDDLGFNIKTKRKSDKKGQKVPLSELGFKAKVHYNCYDGRPKKIFGRFKRYFPFYIKEHSLIKHRTRIITCQG